MRSEHLEWRHCIAANIKHIYTDEEGNIWHGTKVFPVGRKVFIGNRYSKEAKEIVVMGLNRFKSKYDWGWVPLNCVENIRPHRTFKPRVVELMGEWESKFLWWGATWEDQYDVEAYSNMLISEQVYGYGYEDYLRNRLINGLEGEMIKANIELKNEVIYSNADLPLDYLYIGNDCYPAKILKDVLHDYPEYLEQWPRLQSYLE